MQVARSIRKINIEGSGIMSSHQYYDGNASLDKFYDGNEGSGIMLSQCIWA